MAKFDPSSIKRGKDEQQIALSYRGGPLAATGAQQTSTLAAGDRAPDARLDDHGSAVRLFDLLRGPQFTAVAYGPRAADALATLAWPTRGAALTRITVNAAGIGDGDHHLLDSTGAFAKSYGLHSDALILVRPDGYVASIATTEMLAKTTHAIRPLTPPGSDAAIEQGRA